MPFYDLRCSDCESEFNIMASMADKTKRSIPCPECGSLNLETVYIAAPAYIKGGRGDNVPVCPNSRSCGVGCQNFL